MRHIQFRAWDGEDMLTNLDSVPLGALKVSAIEAPDGEPVISCVYMQFTGRKDINGVDIYEDDLLKNKLGRTGKVVWHEHAAGFDTEWMSDDNPDQSINRSYGFACNLWPIFVEVIGNAHENPELLRDFEG